MGDAPRAMSVRGGGKHDEPCGDHPITERKQEQRQADARARFGGAVAAAVEQRAHDAAAPRFARDFTRGALRPLIPAQAGIQDGLLGICDLGPRNGVPIAQARWGAPRGDERRFQ